MILTRAAIAILVITAAVSAQQTELVQVVPPPPPLNNPAYNNFAGAAVAISEEWAVVGDYAAGRTGEVYLYRKTPSGWRFEHRLVEGPEGTRFGSSLAMDGDTLVVGAFNWGWPVNRHGKAYVYRWSGSEWGKVQELCPGLWNEVYPFFGHALALSGDTLVISAPGVDQPVMNAGAVFLYERIQGTWVLVQRFGLPPVPNVLNKVYGTLGEDVAVSGNTVVASAAYNYGAALVYERGPSGWVQSATLRNPTPQIGDNFGLSVAIAGDTIAVGMPALSVPLTCPPGKAYVFERNSADGWTLAQEIRARDGWGSNTSSDWFGTSLALDDDRLVVAAPYGKYNGASSGTVYSFIRGASGWPPTESERFVASDPSPVWGERLGYSVDIHQDFVLSGAVGGWVGDISPGKALTFTIELGTSYCEPPGPGPHARLSLTGSELARSHRLTLTVRDAPSDAHGLFLVSQTSASVPFGSHQLCLGAPLVRLATALAGPEGVALQDVDWTDPRLAGKLGAGSTWYCQLAHEGKGSGQRIELSNAVSLTLQ